MGCIYKGTLHIAHCTLQASCAHTGRLLNRQTHRRRGILKPILRFNNEKEDNTRIDKLKAMKFKNQKKILMLSDFGALCRVVWIFGNIRRFNPLVGVVLKEYDDDLMGFIWINVLLLRQYIIFRFSAWGLKRRILPKIHTTRRNAPKSLNIRQWTWKPEKAIYFLFLFKYIFWSNGRVCNDYSII